MNGRNEAVCCGGGQRRACRADERFIARDESARCALGCVQAEAVDLAERLLHGVGVDDQIESEFTHRRKLLAGLPTASRDVATKLDDELDPNGPRVVELQED